MLRGSIIYNQKTVYFCQYISASDLNILELLLEIFMTYLLFHILAVGIDYMPTYIYQIPNSFRFAKCHSICILLGDFFGIVFFLFFLMLFCFQSSNFWR